MEAPDTLGRIASPPTPVGSRLWGIFGPGPGTPNRNRQRLVGEHGTGADQRQAKEEEEEEEGGSSVPDEEEEEGERASEQKKNRKAVWTGCLGFAAGALCGSAWSGGAGDDASVAYNPLRAYRVSQIHSGRETEKNP